MTDRPTPPSPALRQRVLARDDMVCQLCNRACLTHAEIFGPRGRRSKPLAGRDIKAEAGVLLLIPRAQGGRADISNLVTACRGCSSSKGARDMDGWRAAIIRRYDWEDTRL